MIARGRSRRQGSRHERRFDGSGKRPSGFRHRRRRVHRRPPGSCADRGRKSRGRARKAWLRSFAIAFGCRGAPCGHSRCCRIAIGPQGLCRCGGLSSRGESPSMGTRSGRIRSRESSGGAERHRRFAGARRPSRTSLLDRVDSVFRNFGRKTSRSNSGDRIIRSSWPIRRCRWALTIPVRARRPA